MNKLIKLVLIGFFPFLFLFSVSTDAYAIGCGPRLSAGVSNTAKDDFRGGTLDTGRFDLRLTWNLGENYCEEQELEDWKKKQEDREKQEILNIERMIALCEKHKNKPILTQKCEDYTE